MPHRSKSAGVSQASILLLEEYDALAAAITSALRKFAPKHKAAVARSLTGAEKLATEFKPALFVLDVDPPWRGLTNFLEKISESHPNVGALVIGGAIPAGIANARGQAGALQFIEKPFELAAFGAAVQALLGPSWREQDGRGTLGGLSTLDVLLAHHAANSNVLVQVESRKRTGEIQVSAGQVVHATTGKLKGEDAFEEILSWSKTHFGERKLSGSVRRTISDWQTVALEALGDVAPPVVEQPIAKPEAIERSRGKRVVVVDDTEMLLIFVEDTLSSALPDLQITTALSATEGLREIERRIPDLVLLDYSLPDFNGDELCERLLRNERTARIPVLLMSGHVLEMNAAAARLPNIVAKIEKPFFSEALVDLVQRTLEKGHEFEALIEEEQFEPAVTEPEPEAAIEPEPEPEPEMEPPPPLIVAPPPPPPRPIPVVPKKKVVVEPPRRAIVPPPLPLAPIQSHIERHTPAQVAAAPTIRVAPTDGNGAVLGIFLEVLSMQLT
ncbi:MAG TPA: response regulator, partial [Chthoniobacterales bacterium]